MIRRVFRKMVVGEIEAFAGAFREFEERYKIMKQ